MRIAIAYDNGNIFDSFEKTKTIKIVDESKGILLGTSMLEVEGNDFDSLIGTLYKNCVDVVICNSIEKNTIKSLTDIKIKIVSNQTGNVDDIVKKFLNKEIKYTYVNSIQLYINSGNDDK